MKNGKLGIGLIYTPKVQLQAELSVNETISFRKGLQKCPLQLIFP